MSVHRHLHTYEEQQTNIHLRQYTVIAENNTVRDFAKESPGGCEN